MNEKEKIYFKCPKCKKIIERSKDNPFIKWKFLKLFCKSFCEETRRKSINEEVIMDEKEAIKILNRRINQLRLKFAITNEDLEAIETVLNLLEKKDKIIDEMAKKLSQFDYSQYCEVTNCNYPPCNKEKCIKQYYERKVENE